MATTNSRSDAAIIENFRIALENSTANSEIATALADIGYDETVINEGRTLLQTAQTAFSTNLTEDDETVEAYNTFDTQRSALAETYTRHRKKAKVIFRTDPVSLDKLALKGITPKAYVAWIQSVKKFYETANTSEEIKTKLARLTITEADITAALAAITELENARVEYLREKGESQEATLAKDEALRELSTWMGDFYAVARIALEDKPQLMEALGKVVRR